MNFFSDDESETEDETDTVSGVRAPSASDRNDAPGLDGRPALDSSEGDVRPFSSVGAAGGVCRQDLAAHASDSESSDAGTSQCAGSKKVILTGKTPLLSAPAADNRVDLDSGDVLSEFHESPRPVHALQGLLKGSDGVRDLQPEGLRPRQQVQRSMNVFARLDAQSHTKESSHLTPLNSARSIGEVSASGTGCSRSRSDLWVAGSSPARSLREVPESCSANSMTAGFGNDVSSDSADNVLRDALQHHGLSLYEHASPPDDGKIRTNPSEVDPSLRRLSLSSRDSPRLPRSVGGSGLQLMERARNTQRSVGEVTAETSYSRSDVRYASGSLDPSHGDAPASVSPSATRLDAASSTSEGRMLSADEVLQEALGFTHWHDGSATVIQDANNVRTLRPFPSEVSFAAQDEMHFHSEGKVGAHLEAHDDEASS